MSNQAENTEEFRNLLRKKLGDTMPTADGWNVPSADVWTGLSEELASKNQDGRRGGRLYLFGGITVALLAMLLLRECSHQRVMGEMQSELQKKEAAFSQLQAACDEKQIPINKEEVPAGNQDLISANRLSGETTALSLPVQKEAIKNSQKTAKKTSPSNLEESVLFETKDKNQEPNLSLSAIQTVGDDFFEIGKNQADETTILPKKTALAEALPLMPLGPLFYKTSKPSIDLNLPSPDGSTTPPILFIASFHAGMSLTGNRLTGEQPAVISNQKSLLAYRTGVGLEGVFSPHWSVETGLHYTTSRTQTEYQLEVPFTNAGEFQADDGNFDNQYDHSLPSSLGNYPAQLVLTRSNTENVGEGELMNLDLVIHQQMRFLSLPLHLRYGFGKGLFQAGIKGGIVANRTLGIASEASSLVSHHGAIHQRHTSIGNPAYDDLQKTTFDYSIGLDARYYFSPRFSLSLETSYQQGFTPIYKDELVNNYLKAWNMGVAARLAL